MTRGEVVPLETAAAGLIEKYERRELIDGQTVMMSTTPGIRHRSIQRNLSAQIYNYLRGKRCQVFFETLVVFDENNHFFPDVLVVCDKSKIKFSRIEGAPDFIAEVLSPSTRKYDLSSKKDIYEKYGVKEYWLIDPAAETVDTYILREGKFVFGDSYHNYGAEDRELLDEKEKAAIRLTLKLSLYDDFAISVKELFEG